jgi:hypothetical protein
MPAVQLNHHFLPQEARNRVQRADLYEEQEGENYSQASPAMALQLALEHSGMKNLVPLHWLGNAYSTHLLESDTGRWDVTIIACQVILPAGLNFPEECRIIS